MPLELLCLSGTFVPGAATQGTGAPRFACKEQHRDVELGVVAGPAATRRTRKTTNMFRRDRRSPVKGEG